MPNMGRNTLKYPIFAVVLMFTTQDPKEPFFYLIVFAYKVGKRGMKFDPQNFTADINHNFLNL